MTEKKLHPNKRMQEVCNSVVKVGLITLCDQAKVLQAPMSELVQF